MSSKRLKDFQNGRLVYYQKVADSNYWDNYWDSVISPEYYDEYEKGELDEYSQFFEKYLDKRERILEAGCGTAKYVVALRSRGYSNVEGVEWGQKTVQKVLELYPNLPIKVGDVINLHVPDDHYEGYISLGVVEHRREGPEPFLKEAYRVLKPGGVALFSVPYVNPLRNIKGALGFYRLSDDQKVTFYQYAFRKSEFRLYLKQAGFTILETKSIHGYFGFKEELPFLFDCLDKLPGRYRIRKYLKHAGWLHLLGHSVLFVCRKVEQ